MSADLVLTLAARALAAFLHSLARCPVPPQKRQRLLVIRWLRSLVVSLPSLPSVLERSSVVFLDEEAELPLPEGVDVDAEEVFSAVEDVVEVDVFLEDLLLLLLDLS